MSAPLIGITTFRTKVVRGDYQISLYEAYFQAVEQAGGIPLLIPTGLTETSLSELVDVLDGLLLSGGGDIETVRFAGKAHPNVREVDIERDNLEFTLVKLAIKADLPLFGICRGLQVMNVALGGTLYSDIEDQYTDAQRHNYYPGYPQNYPAHSINIVKDSLLARILGATIIKVNSVHHQGIKRIASELIPTAFADDKMVEAVELVDYVFGLGVQWHPEWMLEFQPMQALFKSFVQAADAVK